VERSRRTCFENLFSVWPVPRLRKGLGFAISEFPFESLVEDGWEQGVKFGGGLGLKHFHTIHLCLQTS